MKPLLCALLCLVPPEDDEGARPAAAPPPAQVLPSSSLTSQATERAVESGLAYLARLQARSGDGSFAVTDVDQGSYAPLGISALCALAFLSAGSAPDRGPHGEVVSQALEYLLLHTDLAPESAERGYISVQGDKVSQTHGHGYATLVLAQAYGMSSGSERIRTALVAAVQRIEASQGVEGGWYYDPRPTPDHEGSVTICLVQALRAARDAGIQVDAEVIRRAEDYVRRLQTERGLFCYRLGEKHRTSVGLTAAGIATLNAAGRYDDRAIQDGVNAIWASLTLRDDRPDFPEYERLYVAQAFWQLSDTSHFQRWFADERERILRSQRDDGSWPGSRFGSAYVTAVNCLVLSLPDAALPIFQR